MDRRTFLAAASSMLSAPSALAQSTGRQTQNIIFITTDGLRWEDLFRGADPALINKPVGGVSKPEALKERFWKDSSAERRELLMPFVWKTVAKHGQLFGNRDRGSDAYVTNGMNFSYPGYSELLTGAPDDRIDSNDAINNPN
ncbi:MAG: phosphoglyceromutase, partial [Bryobacterales bacterium]|nr:phosphoglyceromutase [Bryobacterales bacterium]